jgi:hypothetical protein
MKPQRRNDKRRTPLLNLARQDEHFGVRMTPIALRMTEIWGHKSPRGFPTNLMTTTTATPIANRQTTRKLCRWRRNRDELSKGNQIKWTHWFGALQKWRSQSGLSNLNVLIKTRPLWLVGKSSYEIGVTGRLLRNLGTSQWRNTMTMKSDDEYNWRFKLAPGFPNWNLQEEQCLSLPKSKMSLESRRILGRMGDLEGRPSKEPKVNNLWG